MCYVERMKMLVIILFLSPLLSFAEEQNIKEQKVCLLNEKPGSFKGPEKRMAKIIKKISEKVEERNCQKGDILFLHTSNDSLIHSALLCDLDTLESVNDRRGTLGLVSICEYIGYTREERERIN